MRLRMVCIILVAAFPLLAVASSPSQRARGAAVFADSGCQHCHSIHNVGGHTGPDLSNVGKRKTESQIRHQIVYGSKIMPPFGNILQRRQLNDLLAYLRSCRD